MLSLDPPARLFCVNETVTTAKLCEQLSCSKGVYLNLQDEIVGLLERLDTSGGPDPLDRSLVGSL